MAFSYLEDTNVPGMASAGATMILNMLTISGSVIEQFVDRGGIGDLCALLFDAEEDETRVIAAKGLVIVAKRSKLLD